MKGEGYFSDELIFTAIKQESIDDALVAWPEIAQRVEEITAEWIGFRNAVEGLCVKGAGLYQGYQLECPGDPREAKKRYAMLVLATYKPISSFLFEAVKENADLEMLYKKIEYKELRSFWIPALESIE